MTYKITFHSIKTFGNKSERKNFKRTLVHHPKCSTGQQRVTGLKEEEEEFRDQNPRKKEGRRRREGRR